MENVVTARDLEDCLKNLFSSGKSYSFNEIYQELIKQYPYSQSSITKMLERLIGREIVRLDPLYDPTSCTLIVNFQINV